MRSMLAAVVAAAVLVGCGGGIEDDTAVGDAAPDASQEAADDGAEDPGADDATGVDDDEPVDDTGDDDDPVDEDPPAPEDADGDEAASAPFRMEVADSFRITDVDEPLVTGQVASGTVTVGDALCLDGTPVTVTGIEVLREVRERATVGETVGMLLAGVELDAIEVGMVLAPC